MNDTYKSITTELFAQQVEGADYVIFLLCHEIDKLKDRLDGMQKETFEGDK